MASDATTEFAPAARAGPEEIARQRYVLHQDSAFASMMERVPSCVMVLNRQRQVLYANRATFDAAVISPPERAIGRRVGELFGCVHSAEPPAGCGTTRFCTECGAVRAILAGIHGETTVEECRLRTGRGRGEEGLDLRVWSSPLAVEGESFTLVVAVSIEDEKRRDFLERIFLHDILNSAAALQASATVAGMPGLDAPARDRALGDLSLLARRVVRELEAHRLLVSAESGELVPEPRALGTLAPLREIVAAWSIPGLLDGRVLRLDPASEDLPLVADPALVARVLGNLVKNALEASTSGQAVTVGCRSAEGRAVFWFHNESCMPEPVRLQVFQRSFSTKGRGRGLGTYSARFLVERYLGGTVDFSSTPAEGTVFRVRLPLRPPAPPGTEDAAGG